MNLSDAGVSFVRTATPILVGVLLTSVAAPYLDPGITTEFVAGFLALAWYAVFRALEISGLKQAGWFLGVALEPVYRVDTSVLAEVPESEREEFDGSEGSYAK
jgi:hypothetical protein